MKKILFSILFVAFTAKTAFGQDTATQQRLDELSGQIQTMEAALGQQSKRLDALEKEISDLGEKVNSPQVNNSASVDDLKKLAGQVQDLAKKQQDDNDLIVKQIEKLGQLAGGSSTSHMSRVNSETPATGGDNPVPPPNVPQKGYYYPIKPNDTVSAIAKAYRGQGVKVTIEQILAANPGLDPLHMIVGKKIFIPDPDAK